MTNFFSTDATVASVTNIRYGEDLLSEDDPEMGCEYHKKVIIIIIIVKIIVMIIVMIVRCNCDDGDVDSPLRVLPRHCQPPHPWGEEGDRDDCHDYPDNCRYYTDNCHGYILIIVTIILIIIISISDCDL